MTMALSDEQLLENREAMGEIDPDGMTRLIEDLPQQWREAETIARAAAIEGIDQPKSIVVLGMGGSAIGGDLVKSLLDRRPRCRSWSTATTHFPLSSTARPWW